MTNKIKEKHKKQLIKNIKLYFISTLKSVKGMEITKEIKQKEMKLIYDSFKEQERTIIDLKYRLNNLRHYFKANRYMIEIDKVMNMIEGKLWKKSIMKK